MRTLRIDTAVLSTQKLNDILKEYARKGKADYCFVEEQGSQTGKPHNQGWYVPVDSKADSAILKSFKRKLEGTKSNDKAMPIANKPENHVAYLINNTNKPKPSYADVYTNYTEDKYNEFQEHKQFVEHRPSKLAKPPKKQDWWWSCCDELERQCVIDGTIIYGKLPSVFAEQPGPKKLSKAIMAENLNGMIYHLEYKHGGRRYRNDIEEFIRKDRSIFYYTSEELFLIKKQKDNKNATQELRQKEEDLSQEEEAGSPCSHSSGPSDYDSS